MYQENKLVSVSKKGLIQRIRCVCGRLKKQKGSTEIAAWKAVISGHSSLIPVAEGEQTSRHSKAARSWEFKGGGTVEMSL